MVIMIFKYLTLRVRCKKTNIAGIKLNFSILILFYV